MQACIPSVRVLVVDPERKYCDALRDKGRSLGVHVTVCHHSEELESRRFEVDAVLLSSEPPALEALFRL